ncbi:MAG: anaerobic sulfatase maturase [Pseudoflavonifractor sp.]
MKQVNLLIKPASSGCNMSCHYCFYRDLAKKRDQGDRGLMSRDTAAVLIRWAFEAVDDGGQVQFSFQGGEPTLAGLSFFRSFVDLASEYRRPGVTVSYAIQTNGLAMDQAWADFFRDHRFLVGLSVDGPKDLHDLHRPDAGGNGTWDRVTANLRLLQERGVPTNLLCVVTRQSAHAPRQTYAALKKLGVRYLQFIPCLDPLEEPRGTEPYSIAPEEYGRFLCRLFDAWYLDWKRGEYISIRLFDDYVHLMMGLSPSTCATAGACGAYLVVEADGKLDPCDFYAVDHDCLCRVGSSPLSEVISGEAASAFRAESAKKPKACKTCPWFSLCRGGCQRDWVATEQGFENYLCPAFRQFFAYAERRLDEIASAELQHQGKS